MDQVSNPLCYLTENQIVTIFYTIVHVYRKI